MRQSRMYIQQQRTSRTKILRKITGTSNDKMPLLQLLNGKKGHPKTVLAILSEEEESL